MKAGKTPDKSNLHTSINSQYLRDHRCSRSCSMFTAADWIQLQIGTTHLVPHTKKTIVWPWVHVECKYACILCLLPSPWIDTKGRTWVPGSVYHVRKLQLFRHTLTLSWSHEFFLFFLKEFLRGIWMLELNSFFQLPAHPQAPKLLANFSVQPPVLSPVVWNNGTYILTSIYVCKLFIWFLLLFSMFLMHPELSCIWF